MFICNCSLFDSFLFFIRGSWELTNRGYAKHAHFFRVCVRYKSLWVTFQNYTCSFDWELGYRGWVVCFLDHKQSSSCNFSTKWKSVQAGSRSITFGLHCQFSTTLSCPSGNPADAIYSENLFCNSVFSRWLRKFLLSGAILSVFT